ncbi:hypothetical protein J4573_37975 [Actinomadura barringtoniae]|uniref:SH3 domain-containing protein n=1 Tax=Actinomadura barringtoniae TaxID=1427535 RepID=A0A939T4T2_9ACTN|nr:hypothetical protein [Actinomadura barringtoniae]MBO2452931.1 hypothetical protein [Actinomadura barringtoniae]
MALSIAGLATGGAVMLASGAADAATAAPTQDGAAVAMSPVCRYTVGAMHGLNVREKPAGKKIGALRNGKIVFAKKCRNPRGWVKLRGGVKKKYMKKYVYRHYLARY